MIAGSAAETITESIDTTTEAKQSINIVILNFADFLCSMLPSFSGSICTSSSSDTSSAFASHSVAASYFFVSSEIEEGSEVTVFILVRQVVISVNELTFSGNRKRGNEYIENKNYNNKFRYKVNFRHQRVSYLIISNPGNSLD